MKIKPGDVVRLKKSFGGPAIEDCRTIYFISTRRGVHTYHTGSDPVTDLKLKNENIIDVVGFKSIAPQKYYKKLYKLNTIINSNPTYYPEYEVNNYWYWSKKRIETLYKKFEIKKEKAKKQIQKLLKDID